MLVKAKRGWEIPECEATPESVYTNRRALLKAMGYGTLLAATASPIASAFAAEATPADPSAKLYPFKRNDKYKLDRPITEAKYSTTYNNFYEFSTDKDLVDLAQALPIRPWTIAVDGMVEKPFEIGIDDLMKKMALEERLYRHRCVEAWSMAVPWSGFALKDFVALCKPASGATYLKMLTFSNPAVAPGQNQIFYPWPYTEGLTMAEATNELPFLATGMYGKPVPKQDGAPLRLVVPWKYGFKSIKSIVKFTFTDKRPRTFWEDLQESEYGFWANVNPAVPHPRWSQATERVIGTDQRVPTQMWNGYGDYVAHLYDQLKGERLYV
ncbi:MAG TPA: protein-methionine-sulfoxide reductase catalytic subunit MsrP [Stellaceae bacterium]|jgi:sulfoxide reductase catalytic subunit YedY|nr:protein-methionine-sulfoxide reductase catalytic subunit MsrP [Stellaceae bacterium]